MDIPVIMKKKIIIYSLTGRGLFSELSNLVLAVVYAKYNDEELIVNTRNWNARVEKGWRDYFESTLPDSNSLICSQYRIYTKEKPWWGNIYYNPSAFFRHYAFYMMNRIFLLFHPDTELGDDVFMKMRSKEFVEKYEDVRNEYSLELKRVLKFNLKTINYIQNEKNKLNLPEYYIGVHIRRGDKIASCEMEEVSLTKYVDAIKDKRHISHNVFIATDDVSVIDGLRSALDKDGFSVYWNTAVVQNGFDESLFNNKDKRSRYIDTLNMFLDMDILAHSLFFIGTYTSNVSRIVPLYIGFEKSLSLDEGWKI